jgi:hypothetical protein
MMRGVPTVGAGQALIMTTSLTSSRETPAPLPSVAITEKLRCNRPGSLLSIITLSGPVIKRALTRASCLSIILYAMLLGSSLCGDASAQPVRVLSSDLNFLMDCKDRDPSTLEGPIEEFFET